MASKIVRPVFALLVLGIAVHAGHALIGPGDGPLDHIIASWVYTAVMWIGSAMCLLAAATRRRERGGWTLIGLGLLLWSGGDLVWTLWLTPLADPPYPSVADGLYLGSYIAIYAGLLLLLRGRLRTVRPAQWLDGAVGGLAAAAVVAALVFPALAGITEGKTIDVAFNLAYPVCDVLLLTLIVMAFGLNRWRVDRSWLLLGLGQFANVVADSAFSYQSAVGTYVTGSWVDTLWPVGITLTAAAAWQRAPRAPVDEIAGRTLSLTAGFAAIALGVLVIGQFTTVHPVAAVLATAALLVAGARGAILFRENLRLLRSSSHESLTDGLTGLANRRALMRDLEVAAADATATDRRTLGLFDLDGFKQYNDAFGHAAGDMLLHRLGADLDAAVAGHGSAYRLGGDEFCVLFDHDAGAGDPIVVAALDALAEPARSLRGRGVLRPGLAARRCARRRRGAAPGRSPDVRAQARPPLDAGRGARGPAGRPGRARARSAAPHARRGRARAPGGHAPRPRRRGPRRRGARGRAARHRQGRGPRRDPAQARPAGRGRLDLHPPAHDHRRAHRRRGRGAAARRSRRARQPRALGRRRLPRRPGRRGHPAGLAHRVRL